MKHGRQLAVVAALALVLSACTPSSTNPNDPSADAPDGYLAQADPSVESSGTLHIQLDYDMAEPTGLDPAGAELARGWQLTGLVYDTLVDIGPNFEIVPSLASSFEQTSDTEYVFTLRDATFSNGRAVTPDDVIGSLQRLIDLQTLWGAQLGPISSMVATGDNEVTVTLERPHTAFLAALANGPASIIPIAELASGFDPATEMIGSGPFVVEDHRQDESWTFVRNPEYWGDDTLGIDRLEISIVGDDQTRMAGLRDGSVQLANFANPDALDLLGSAQNVTAVNQSQSNFFYVFLNSVNPDSPFTDQALRQAVNAAIDREQLADLALAGLAEPSAVTPSNLPGACDPSSLPTVGGDTSAIDGQSLSLLIYNDDPALAALAQVIQQQLQAQGATVTIETLDYATFADRVFVQQPGDFEMALGWFAGYADPSMVTGWWNPERSFFNLGFAQSHDDLNAAIDAAAVLPNGDERDEALQDLCELADEYSEMVPLVTQPMIVAYRADLVSPTLLADEGYGDFLRLIGEFRLIGAE